MSRKIAAIGLALVLSGCGMERAAEHDPARLADQVGVAALVLDGAVLMASGKTIDDHVISAVSGKDCSIVRAEQGGPYCVDIPPPVPMVAVTSYCYKSLARVSCYAAPFPVDLARYDGSRTDLVPAPQ